MRSQCRLLLVSAVFVLDRCFGIGREALQKNFLCVRNGQNELHLLPTCLCPDRHSTTCWHSRPRKPTIVPQCPCFSFSWWSTNATWLIGRCGTTQRHWRMVTFDRSTMFTMVLCPSRRNVDDCILFPSLWNIRWQRRFDSLTVSPVPRCYLASN